jgi:hypothetical protein
MDDWVVLAKTRHHLRAAVKNTHQVLESLKLTLHPDKTFIGRIERGFKFFRGRFLLKKMVLVKPTSVRRIGGKSYLCTGYSPGSGCPPDGNALPTPEEES